MIKKLKVYNVQVYISYSYNVYIHIYRQYSLYDTYPLWSQHSYPIKNPARLRRVQEMINRLNPPSLVSIGITYCCITYNIRRPDD